MPTYIIDGYRLLYAYSAYSDYRDNLVPHEVHTVMFYYVPSDYVLSPDANDWDLFHFSNGYSVSAQIDTSQYDEIEDSIEGFNELGVHNTGTYGGFTEMTRDGRTVLAYAGGDDVNYYRATLVYHLTDFSKIKVTSDYHTLDELMPVFNSVGP